MDYPIIEMKISIGVIVIIVRMIVVAVVTRRNVVVMATTRTTTARIIRVKVGIVIVRIVISGGIRVGVFRRFPC
jgi:hypothetical protein